MKPSDLKGKHPWSSVMGNAECETVAHNIVRILARTTDTFRTISYEEYVLERSKDGNFSDIERTYFGKVVDYCSSEQNARTFCEAWKETP